MKKDIIILLLIIINEEYAGVLRRRLVLCALWVVQYSLYSRTVDILKIRIGWNVNIETSSILSLVQSIWVVTMVTGHLTSILQTCHVNDINITCFMPTLELLLLP